MKDYSKLMQTAMDMRYKSYVPYSHFHVGAALLTNEGYVYTGCNIENSSYGATNCAERTALFKAISEGEREFEAIAIAAGREEGIGDLITVPAPPCGICRQVIREFCGPDFKIVLHDKEGNIKVYTLSELLPESFGPENL